MEKRKPPRLRACTECGSKRLRNVSIDHEIDVGNTAFRGKVPGQACEDCGEDFAEGPALLDMELAAALSLAKYDPTPDGFRFVRAVAQLRANELAELLDVAPETVSRRENGKREIDRAAWLLLSGIARDRAEGHSTTLDRLREAAKGMGRGLPKRKDLVLKPA